MPEQETVTPELQATESPTEVLREPKPNRYRIPSFPINPRRARWITLGSVTSRTRGHPTMKEVAQRSKRVAAFLKPSQPVAYDSDGLIVEVQSEFHAGQMATEANSLILADALYAALGLKPFLRFAERGAEPLDSETGAQSSGDASAGSASETAGSYADAAEAVDADHDPVELLKKGFDAEVVREVEE